MGFERHKWPRPRRGPSNETIVWEGKIERLAWGGIGISRLADGRTLLLEAPLVLFPGERVKASIRIKPKHAEGEVTEWLTPSPNRVAPECQAAGKCGGCTLHGAGPLRSDMKRAMVEDLFRRMLQIESWEWLSAPPYALRSRIQLHWNGEHVGFHQRKKNIVVPINACPAAESNISESIPRFEEAIAAKILPTRPQRWELATGTPQADVFAIDELQRTWLLEPDGWKKRDGKIVHHFCGHALSHRPGGFFQVSAKWAMEAFHEVLTEWDVHGSTLYDIYGGVGLFSVLLGDKFDNCVLVESDGDSVASAAQNLANANISHQCIEMDAAKWIVELQEGFGSPNDVVLLDPPREGLPPEMIGPLQKSNVGAIVLVGCDGATFCRDVKRLNSDWRPKKIAAIDLFPMTPHVECVALLKRA